MDTNKRIYRRKLLALEHLRRNLARRIDHSYLRDDISSYLELESRYKEVIETMQQLRAHLKPTIFAK